MTESAQLFKGVHDTPVYTDILFKKPLRLWVAVSLYGGTALTVVLTHLGTGFRACPRHLDLRAFGYRRRRRRSSTDPPRAAHPGLPHCQRVARPASRRWPAAPLTRCWHRRAPSSAT